MYETKDIQPFPTRFSTRAAFAIIAVFVIVSGGLCVWASQTQHGSFYASAYANAYSAQPRDTEDPGSAAGFKRELAQSTPDPKAPCDPLALGCQVSRHQRISD